MKLGKKNRLCLVQELTTGHTKFSHTHTQTHFTHTQLFWIQIALQTGGCKTLCTQALLHTDFSIHRGFCTKIVWQRETCTHRRCDHIHTLLTQHTRTHKGIEKQRCFADKDILNSNVLHRKTSLFCCSLAFQGDAFTRRQTKLFSHTKAFTRTGFHTNPVSPIFLAHREEFVHENVCLGPTLLHATAFPHRRFFAWTHSMLLLDEMLRSSDLVLNPSATILVFKKRKPILAIKILETLTVKYRTPGCLFGCLLGLQKLLLFLHFHPTSGPPLHALEFFLCAVGLSVCRVFFVGFNYPTESPTFFSWPILIFA